MYDFIRGEAGRSVHREKPDFEVLTALVMGFLRKDAGLEWKPAQRDA